MVVMIVSTSVVVEKSTYRTCLCEVDKQHGGERELSIRIIHRIKNNNMTGQS